VQHLALRVGDLARARKFYVDTLGFAPILEDEKRVIVQIGQTFVGLAAPHENTKPGDRFDPFRVGLDHIAIAVDGRPALESLLKQLEAAGVQNNGIEDDRVLGGLYISVHDPDGIAWEFYVPPGAA
jgi:catechol-2,3-dioxygenase